MTSSRQSAGEGKKRVRRGSATERMRSGRPLARMSSAKLMGMPPVSYHIATVGHRQECLGCEECSVRPRSGQDGPLNLSLRPVWISWRMDETYIKVRGFQPSSDVYLTYLVILPALDSDTHARGEG